MHSYLTRDVVMAGLLKLNPAATQADLFAWYQFAEGFQVLDSLTFEEAQEKILLSMDLISVEIEDLDNRTAHLVLKDRYSFIGGEL